MKKIKHVMYMFLCMSILLTLNACGNKIDSYNEEFLENYEYLTNNIWSLSETNEDLLLAFIPSDRNDDGNLCGEILSGMGGGVFYEVVEIDAIDKFTICSKEEWILTINQENATVTCEFEDGTEMTWNAVTSKNGTNDKAYEGEINLRENYAKLINNLWESDSIRYNFIPSEEKTKGMIASTVYSYDVLEETSDDEILVYAKNLNRDIINKILFVVDRENDTLQMKTNSDTIEMILCTPDERNDALTTYEYIVKNLWYKGSQDTIVYFQPINNKNVEKCGLIGEIVYPYEIIKADDRCITCRVTSTDDSSEETIQEIIQIEIENNSDYINIQFVGAGETMKLHCKDVIDCTSLSDFENTEDNVAQMLHDQELDSFYERLCDLEWVSKDSGEILTFTDKNTTIMNELYGEFQIDGVRKGCYFITDFDTQSVSGDTGKVYYGLDWLENGELRKGTVLVAVLGDSIELEWTEIKDGTLANRQCFIAK